jgi:hypothetical protein
MRALKIARRIERCRALRDGLQLVLINYGAHYSSVAMADKLSAISFQPSAFSPQLSALSFQPGKLSFQPSAFSHQLSAISFRPGKLSFQPSLAAEVRG